VKQALLWRAAAGRFSVDPATIGHLKSESRGGTGSGLLSAPDVKSPDIWRRRAPAVRSPAAILRVIRSC